MKKLTPPKPLTFVHTFKTGHRLAISVRGPLQSEPFRWTPSKPPHDVLQSEYSDFIFAVMPTAASHFNESIPWFIPGEVGDPSQFIIFSPGNESPTTV